MADYALRFNGVVEDFQRVEVPDANDLSFGDASSDSPFSIEAWVKLATDSLPDADIVTKFRGFAPEYDAEWVFIFDENGKLALLLIDEVLENSIYAYNYTEDMTDYYGQWIYVAATYDGSGLHTGIKIYLNGVDVTYNSVENGTYVAMHNTDEVVRIGYGYVHYPFKGEIDEVRISSKERTSVEIAAAWAARGLEVDGDTVALWHFDEGEGVTAYDETENNHDGTITGAVWVRGSKEYFIPNADTARKGIANTTDGGGVHYTEIDDAIGSPDGYTTRVNTGNDGSYELDTYGLPDHSEGSGKINHVKVYVSCRRDAAGAVKAKAAIHTHDTTYYGDEETMTDEFVTYSKTWTENPNTSSAWTWAEVDAMEAGVALQADGAAWSYCTQVYVEVDYTLPMAGGMQVPAVVALDLI